MTYKEFYIKTVDAMLTGDAENYTRLKNSNPKWFAEIIKDILKILRKYTMYGIDD